MPLLTAKCPQCGGELERVRYPGGYLNRDQWESGKAGDWFCHTCPPNGRSAGNNYCYWQDKEVVKVPLACQRCGLDLWQEHSESICFRRIIEQRDDALRDKTIHLNTIEYAREMLMALPFDFGSNDFYESCDQVRREIEHLQLANEMLGEERDMWRWRIMGGEPPVCKHKEADESHAIVFLHLP